MSAACFFVEPDNNNLDRKALNEGQTRLAQESRFQPIAEFQY